MAKIRFSIDSDLSADSIIAVGTDFTENRPRYWPNIDPKVYRVHGTSAASADVTEGSSMFGGIWAREAYEWSEPGTVRATVQDSNAFLPGGTWEMHATPRADGGCHIEVLNHRQARNLRGRAIGTMLTLMGAMVLPQQLQQTLTIMANEARSGVLATGAGR